MTKEYVRNWVSFNDAEVKAMWTWPQLTNEVVVAVIASAVMLPLGLFWESFLWPFLKSFLGYKATPLAPRYRGEFTLNGVKRTEFVELKQRAYRVWGTIRAPEAIEGVYKFEGTLLDNVLRGTYDGTVKTPPTRGSFLLMVPGGVPNAEPKGRFIQPTKDGLVSEEYKWIPT